MTTTPKPNLDAVCAKCGKLARNHGGQHARCPNDTDEHYWHPTDRFTPVEENTKPIPSFVLSFNGSRCGEDYAISDVNGFYVAFVNSALAEDTNDESADFKIAKRIVHCVNTHDALTDRVAELEGGLNTLLVEWRERKKEYEAEWREASSRGVKGKHDRLSASDVRAEVSACIRELEATLLDKAQP